MSRIDETNDRRTLNMIKTAMRNLSGILIACFCLAVMPLAAHAAQTNKADKPVKAIKVTKERLVLMPLRVGEENQNMLGAMETALVQGLQQQYEVFAGEEVKQKTDEIFHKESKKKNCDETRCLEDIAMAFQSDLIAIANVAKIEGGYLLALSIRNVTDNKAVFSNSVACKGCDGFQLVDKLKELSGASAPVAAVPAVEEPQFKINPADPESALWSEVQKSNSADDYGVYLSQYPKGKYAALAKSRIKKLNEQAAAELAQQDQSAWDSASGAATETDYMGYLQTYPKGRFAALAQMRIKKLKADAESGLLKQEQSAWDSATGTASEAGYQNYLNNYPKGRFAALAQVRINEARQQLKKSRTESPGRAADIELLEKSWNEYKQLVRNTEQLVTNREYRKADKEVTDNIASWDGYVAKISAGLKKFYPESTVLFYGLPISTTSAKDGTDKSREWSKNSKTDHWAIASDVNFFFAWRQEATYFYVVIDSQTKDDGFVNTLKMGDDLIKGLRK